ncbi:MAG: hypothetical protein ACQEQD_10875 [Bacillota bacterium]
MGVNYYSDEELIAFYEDKTIEKGAKPTVKEINQDPYIADYSTFYRRFGGEKEIIDQSKIPYEVLKEIRKICNDCQYNSEECGRKPYQCLKGAEEYFQKE